MATENNRKYLDLTGLQHLIDTLNDQKRLVAHPTEQIPIENAYIGPSAVQIGADANGHVVIGNPLQPSDVGVNNSTIKIKINGIEDSFDLNQAGDKTLAFTIAASDLGVDTALHFKGVYSTLPAVTDYIAGDVVLVDNKEYILALNGTNGAKKWNELGDAESHALKSITITGDNTYITGGGTLAADRTLAHKTYTPVEDTEATPLKIGRDLGGHVVFGGKIQVVSNGAHTHNLSASVPANSFVTGVTPESTKLSVTTDAQSFVTEYKGVTSKLQTTSITGTNGTIKASLVKSSAAVNVATTDEAVTVAKRATEAKTIGDANVGAESAVVTGFTDSEKAAYSASYSEKDECLTFSALTFATVKMKSAEYSSDKIWGCSETDASIIPAKANGSVTNYTFEEVTAAKNGSAITVATGKLNSTDSNGEDVLVGLGDVTTAKALVSASLASGTTGDVTVVSSVSSAKNTATVAISGSALEAGVHKHELE